MRHNRVVHVRRPWGVLSAPAPEANPYKSRCSCSVIAFLPGRHRRSSVGKRRNPQEALPGNDVRFLEQFISVRAGRVDGVLAAAMGAETELFAVAYQPSGFQACNTHVHSAFGIIEREACIFGAP